MSEFYLKVNDRNPILQATLADANGAIDLTSATISFIYRLRNNWVSGAVTGSCSIVSATSGIVNYAWASGDVASPGNYYGEFRAVLSNGKQISFPNDGFINFQVGNSLSL